MNYSMFGAIPDDLISSITTIDFTKKPGNVEYTGPGQGNYPMPWLSKTPVTTGVKSEGINPLIPLAVAGVGLYLLTR